ncbi:MAG TPA: IS1380 family transposase [Smithellaceae bacterium]|nr:IS1380 family transposase [Smithellaceae bacterium]
MVKNQRKDSRKRLVSKHFNQDGGRARRINASTAYGTCGEQLSPFGGLLGLVKFLDLFDFKRHFDDSYIAPSRETKLGDYAMVLGMVMLMFIGFNRIWHFVYIRLEAMLCGIFRVDKLPASSTYWRYLDSLGINQAQALLRIMSRLRQQAWKRCGIQYSHIAVDIDTTVETIYGDQEGGRVGHNPKHRGKKGYRPILCFIEQTREYLYGKLRKGETVSGEETAKVIRALKNHLPLCVQKVLLRADAEFMSWNSVEAALDEGYDFIFSNKQCEPLFDPKTWYRPSRKEEAEFNSCLYKPTGWGQACRFVAMRMPKQPEETNNQTQQELFEKDQYTYRIFCTSLNGKAHEVIERYDKRADAENLIGEAKQEGLDAIPSGRFKNNYAFFQIAMLAYNLWRYFKLLANHCGKKVKIFAGIADNRIRIARLKLLMIGAKVVRSGNRDVVKYSVHDTRTPALLMFYEFLDHLRFKKQQGCKA